MRGNHHEENLDHHGGRGHCPRRHRSERGLIHILFLRLIHEKPMHGYQIMEELSGRGLVESTRLEAGTVYTLLRRMESRGFVSSEWKETEAGPDRRVYKITPDGVEYLRSRILSLARRKGVLDELVAYYEATLKQGWSEDANGLTQ